MIKSIGILLVLILGVLYAPFWLQIILFIVALVLLPFKWVLIIPALFADAWYSPMRDLSLKYNKMLFLVLGMLLLYQLIIRTTRIGSRYGLEKK